MSFNGAGIFQRLYSWSTDRDAGIKIRADRVDAEMDGIATGLSTALLKDGQQVPTANQPMGTFRHTGVGAAVSRTDYARVAETQNSTYAWGGTDTGAANGLVFACSPAITAYVAGQHFAGKIGAAHTNTGACSANFGPGVKTVVMTNGDTPTPSVMEAGRSYEWLYDGTNLVLLNPSEVWTDYTPTVTAQAGTFTTVSATGSYLTTGKVTRVRMVITVTTVGSATGYVLVTLPNTAATSDCFLAGRETAVTGKFCGGLVISSNAARFFLYDGTTAAATGASLSVSGMYQNT